MPFVVIDIFEDNEDDCFVVFGAPQKGSEEHKNGICIMARVPFELGSAICESLLPLAEAADEARNYTAAAEEAWADKWTIGGEDDDDGEGATGTPGLALVLTGEGNGGSP